MYIAMHTTLCEGYLCIEPSLPLFRYLFQCKERGRFVQCGAITFQRRPGVEFPSPHIHKKIENWQKSYFYCKSVAPEGRFDFLPFSELRFSPCEKFMSARAPLTEEELQSIRPLREKLTVLLKKGLRSRNLVASWIMLRVSPLALRNQLLCHYTGTASDPDRWHPDDTDLEFLQWQMRFYVADQVNSLDIGGLPSFTVKNPLPPVSALS